MCFQKIRGTLLKMQICTEYQREVYTVFKPDCSESIGRLTLQTEFLSFPEIFIFLVYVHLQIEQLNYQHQQLSSLKVWVLVCIQSKHDSVSCAASLACHAMDTDMISCEYTHCIGLLSLLSLHPSHYEDFTNSFFKVSSLTLGSRICPQLTTWGVSPLTIALPLCTWLSHY